MQKLEFILDGGDVDLNQLLKLTVGVPRCDSTCYCTAATQMELEPTEQAVLEQKELFDSANVAD